MALSDSDKATLAGVAAGVVVFGGMLALTTPKLVERQAAKIGEATVISYLDTRFGLTRTRLAAINRLSTRIQSTGVIDRVTEVFR